MGFSIPILFLIFNRPEKSVIVFEKIKELKPDRLFIAADGARSERPGESDLCELTRSKVLAKIDWPCEVKLLFRENNLGCKIAVSSAIDWFFKETEMGIILEDDCIPDMSFFHFCQENLLKYQNDPRVMHITGSNFVNGSYSAQHSYYFSRFPNIWGWATWRRAWAEYDVQLQKFPLFKSEKGFKKLFQDKIVGEFFEEFTEIVHNGSFNTWDLQWVFAVLINNGLCIVPNKNLISNIGYGSDATHTVNVDKKLARQEIGNITVIQHPSFINADTIADNIYFDIVHGGKQLRFRETMAGKIDFFIIKVKFKLRQLAGLKN